RRGDRASRDRDQGRDRAAARAGRERRVTGWQRPLPIVLAAPSGAGKTSLARALVERHADIVFSVSATTRPRRDYERDGIDYRFVDDAGFDALLSDGELLEWAWVHGRRYGTPVTSVRESLARGE